MIVCLALLTLMAMNFCDVASFNLTPANGTIIYTCTGNDVILPWKYSLSPGDKVQMSVVLFPDEMKAHVERVMHGKTSQQIIKNVSKIDRGDYSIKIQGTTANGSSFKLTRTLTLEVTDGQETTDQMLHVGQDPSPVWDPTNNRFSIQLVCGNFLRKETPPFDVQWLSPSGKISGSTGYQDGKFYLLLPSSLEGGKYTCRLSKRTPHACLSKDMEATLMVSSQKATLTSVKGNVISVQEQVDTKNLIHQLQQQQDQIKTLQNQMESLKAVGKVEERRVSFHAYDVGRQLTVKKIYDPIMIKKTLLNEGNGYRPSTGDFMAPYPGTYFFSASSGICGRTNYTKALMYMMKNEDQRIGFGRVEVAEGMSELYEMFTINAVSQLAKGDKVWLKSHSTGCLNGYFTSFSGFLVHQ